MASFIEKTGTKLLTAIVIAPLQFLLLQWMTWIGFWQMFELPAPSIKQAMGIAIMLAAFI